LALVVGAIARLIRPPVIACDARSGPRAFRLAFGICEKIGRTPHDASLADARASSWKERA
jgi:hypothetical protein